MEEGQAPPRKTLLPARGTWIALLPALPLILCLGVGFLADDYFILRAIHEFREATPSLASEFIGALGRVWTPDFDIFRPLTILSLQLDSLLWPGAASHYHLTNWALWVCLAWIAAWTAHPKGRPAERLPWFGAMVVSPAALEALGWIVAREDLLVAIFSGLAIRTALDRPRSVAIPVWCALALCAKETGIVLIPLLGLLVAIAPRNTISQGVIVRQMVLLGLTAGAWFAARYLIHGELSGTYNGRAYSSYLREEGAIPRTLQRVAGSLFRVIAPLNDAAWAGVVPWVPASVFRAALGLALGGLLVGGLRKSVPSLRTAVAAVGLLLLPLLLLCVPLEGIGEHLDQSRFACLPLLGLSLIAGPGVAGAARACGPSRVAWFAFVLLSSISLVVSFRPFHQVKQMDSELLASLVRSAGRLPRAVIVDLNPAHRGGGIHPDLLSYQGVHRLSGGLFSATLPPFHPPPGVRLLPWNREVASTLSMANRGPQERYALIRLSAVADRIAFQPILHDPLADPSTIVAPAWSREGLEIRVRTLVQIQGKLQIVALDSMGRQASGTLSDDQCLKLHAGSEVSVSGEALHLAAFDPRIGLTQPVLSLVDGPGLWIQAQIIDSVGSLQASSLIRFVPRPE